LLSLLAFFRYRNNPGVDECRSIALLDALMISTSFYRSLAVWAALASLPAAGRLAFADSEHERRYQSVVRPYLESYCWECHARAKPEGDLRLDEFSLASNAAQAEVWQLVLDNLHLGEMPPADAKQPPLATSEPVIAWIQQELRRAEAVLAGETGEVVLRRLNRLEYEYTIEDLFDVRGDYAAGFPEDASSQGFNTIGQALSLSAEQVTAYLRAADFVLERAIVAGERPKTRSVRFTLEDIDKQRRQKQAERDKKNAESGYTPTPAEVARKQRETESGNYGSPYYPRYGEDSLIPVMFLKPDTGNFFQVKVPGWYRFQVTAYAVRNDGQPMRLQVSYGTNKKEDIPTVAGVIQLTESEPQTTDYRLYLQPGNIVKLEMLDGTKWLPGSRIEADASPAIAIRAIELSGPIIEEWPPRGHQLLLGTTDAAELNDNLVPALLQRLARRLFRRPVPDATLQPFLEHYRNHRRQLDPLAAFRLTVKAMMVSPMFLYHLEPTERLDEFAVANRLAYFLWRSLPDQTLDQCAEQGLITEPSQLLQQAQRLLEDPKAERFLKDFVGQWLQTSKVGEMQPDASLYPEYDADLERAMVQETQLFIGEMLAEDLSLANLIDSDWTMLNDRLAAHYGIPGVEGNHFRKVKLDKSQTVRGGLLTQASFLSVTSNGTTTSPVVRGVWILDRLLGTPAPPPPPDVPPIEPDIRGASTIQEQMEKHRSITQCAICHARIDPYGLALENFDVIGGWRDHYRALIQPEPSAKSKLGQGKPVTASDRLPKQGEFNDFRQFRHLLLQEESLVLHSVAEKLATYALGRRLGFAERDDLQEIVQATRAKGGGLRTLLLTLVQSPLFQRP
jgi:hypothetical protein